MLLAAVLWVAAQETVRGLEKPVTLEQPATLRQHLDLLRERTGATIHLDPRFLAEAESEAQADRKIDLRLREVPASTALRWIARLHGARLEVKDGIAVVRSRRRAADDYVLRPYPALALGRTPRDHPGGRIALPEPGKPGFLLSEYEPGESPVGEELIIDLIKQNVSPGSWEGHATIERDPQGRLVVNALPETHEELRWFLDALRRLPFPNVTLAVTLAEGDDPRAPRVVPPGELDATLRILRKLPARELEITAASDQRVHSLVRRDPTDAALLDVRGTAVDGHRSILVELRLAIAETPESGRAVTRLSASFLVPNGSGALFALPFPDGKPRLCLVRASTAASDRPPKFLLAPDPAPPDPAVRALLEKAPPADLDLDQAPLSHLAAWLRRTAGLNVVVAPVPEEPRVSFRGRNVAPARVLPLLLGGLRWDALPSDGALYLCPDAARVRLALIDARDAACAPTEFTREPDAARASFTGEDIANLVKNLVRRDHWEEADGKSIQIHRGTLFVRNRETVLREVAAFVDERRPGIVRRAALCAELGEVPADRIDAVTGNQAARSLLVDADQRARILESASRRRRLGWVAFEGHRTFVEWERARDGGTASSYLELRPGLAQDGSTFAVDLAFQDQLQAGLVSLRTRVEIPDGGTGLFRFPLLAKEGEPRRAHVLLLTLASIP